MTDDETKVVHMHVDDPHVQGRLRRGCAQPDPAGWGARQSPHLRWTSHCGEWRDGVPRPAGDHERLRFLLGRDCGIFACLGFSLSILFDPGVSAATVSS